MAQYASDIIQKVSDSETSFDEKQPDLLERIEDILVKPSNLVSNISGIDKCVRMTSYVYKFFKAFSVIDDAQLIKRLDVVASKLSFLRTIFLRNRKWMIINEMIKRMKSHKASTRKDLELVLKVYLLGLDSSRLILFLIRLGLIQDKPLDDMLKKINSNGYFLECLCWLSFYTYDYFKSGKNTEKRKESKLSIMKYICDSICSYNDSTFKTYIFPDKVTSALGVMSSVISLYLAWK